MAPIHSRATVDCRAAAPPSGRRRYPQQLWATAARVLATMGVFSRPTADCRRPSRPSRPSRPVDRQPHRIWLQFAVCQEPGQPRACSGRWPDSLLLPAVDFCPLVNRHDGRTAAASPPGGEAPAGRWGLFASAVGVWSFPNVAPAPRHPSARTSLPVSPYGSIAPLAKNAARRAGVSRICSGSHVENPLRDGGPAPAGAAPRQLEQHPCADDPNLGGNGRTGIWAPSHRQAFAARPSSPLTITSN
jgi:hypothetical protein